MKKSNDQYLILSPLYMKASHLHGSNEMQNNVAHIFSKCCSSQETWDPKKLVITGMGLLFVFGSDIDAF